MRFSRLLFLALLALSACQDKTPQHRLEGLSWGIPVALSTGGGRDCDHFVFADTTTVTAADCGSTTRRDDAAATSRLTALAIDLGPELPQNANTAPANLEVVHTRGLIDLWYGVSNDTVLARAVSTLQEASRDPRAGSDIWSDISAALLLRYRRHGDGMDLLTALDAAEHALVIEPTSAAAAWNSALASTWIGLRRTQESAWARYEKVSGRLRPTIDLGDDDIMRSPGENARRARWLDFTREYVWRTVAPAWGRAWLADDAEGTAKALAELDTIVRASHDPDRHHSPRAVQQVVLTTLDTTARRELAEGFVAYGEYWAHFYLSEFTQADSTLARMKRQHAFMKAFPAWTWYLEPLLLTQRSAPEEARKVLATQGPRYATDEYPWVKRRAVWLDALVKLITREQAQARELFITLEQECLVADDEECAVAVPAMRVGAENQMGNLHAAALSGLRAARRAARQPIVIRSWGAFGQLQRGVELNRLSYAAAAMTEETEFLAARTLRPSTRLDNAYRRAQEAISRTEYALPSARKRAIALAQSAVEHAARVAAESPPSIRAASTDFAQELSAQMELLQSNPDMQVVLSYLDSALRVAQQKPNANRLLSLRQLRGRARLRAGDTTAAQLELDSVLTAYRARGTRDATVFAESRLVAMMSNAREQLVRSLLHQQRANAALAVASGLSLVDSLGYTRSPSSPAASSWLAVRQIGDSVLLFTRPPESPGTVRIDLSPITTRTLQSLVARTDDEALSVMYDALIAPWQRRLSALPKHDAAPRLVLDVQGIATRVPWPALHAKQQGVASLPASLRYLVDDYEIVLTPSRRIATIQLTERTVHPSRTLIIDAAPRLGASRLPGAIQEVATLRTIWGAYARVVSTATAEHADLQQAMQSADIVHFAGHAIIDNEIPEQSALRIPTTTGDSLFRASALSTYRLPDVQLMILAACDTRVGRVTPLSGLESLAGVLHRAGVHNVIAAGWPIDDDATVVLMQKLHEALRSGVPPVSALRQAQLALRHDPDPTRNTPSVWAAFQILSRGEQ